MTVPSLVVQKYGGSSVADLPKLRAVAQRVARTRERGSRVVVVVSAMGNTTNELLALARQVSAHPGRRELDMLISVGERVSMALLAMALHELGVPARSFTGSQSGIVTDTSHANARVVEVRPDRVREALERGEVAIVAGFQGVSREKEVTTLGRGGSDTTAVVLAAALGAEECEICSDVDGVYTADPRLVPGAKKLEVMSVDEALAMAQNGAKVLYTDAVEWAQRHGVTLRAAATAQDGGGTRIVPGAAPARVVGITADTQLAWGPVEALERLPTPCVRLATPEGLLIDLRNVHAGLPGFHPAATVAVVGSRAGTDPAWIRRILAAAGPAGPWVAQADAVVFRVPPAEAPALERRLHTALVEGGEGASAPPGEPAS